MTEEGKEQETVYVVTLLARQVQGELVSQLIELVTRDRHKAIAFTEQRANQTTVTVDGVQCYAERGIIEANLE